MYSNYENKKSQFIYILFENLKTKKIIRKANFFPKIVFNFLRALISLLRLILTERASKITLRYYFWVQYPLK